MPPEPRLLLNPLRVRVLLALLVCHFCIYLAVYSGRIESGDSLRYFDAVGSLVDHGDLYLDLSARQYIPSEFDPANLLPLQTASVEPMLLIAAAPLYWLAKVMPGFGLVHTVWLLNIFVTVAAVGVLYVYALALGARTRSAMFVSALFGLCTIAFPYAKTLFREPLVLLWILVAGLALERLRATHYRAWGWVGVAVAALIALALTKASGLAAVPALILVTLPRLGTSARRGLLAFGLVAVAFAILIVGLFALLSLLPDLANRYDIFARLQRLNTEYARTALAAYLLSPGGSLWGTSPVLLLTIPGVWLLWRARGSAAGQRYAERRRYAIAIPLLIISFALAYAPTSGIHWFGGLSWPPRFLMPVVGFVCLGLLPIAERLLSRQTWRWWIVALPLIGASLWVQACAVSVDLETYVAALPPQANGLVEWSGGLYQWDYLRPVVITRLWANPDLPLDFAWDVVGLPEWWRVLAFVAFASAILVLFSARAELHARAGTIVRRATFLLPVFTAITAGLYLRTLYERDPRFLAGDTSLHQMITILNQETRQDDFILLGSPRYESFFLNYGKLWGGRVFVVFKQPGERSSPEQPAQVQSQNPDDLLHYQTQLLIYNLAETRPGGRLFVLSDGGPDIGWSVRPVERFMAAHYGLSRVFTTSPLTRLTEFSTTPMPDDFLRTPNIAADMRFGDAIRLDGFTLPAGATTTPGGYLPVALHWQTSRRMEASYTIALYLRDANGGAVGQTDWQPGAGFQPTTFWLPNLPVWDYRALSVPDTLAPGEYQLWVKVYDFPAGGAQADLPVRGEDALDSTIGRLPVTIQVLSP